MQVFAAAFMRLHDSGALRDEGGRAVLFGRLRELRPRISSPPNLFKSICPSKTKLFSVKSLL